jgi:hypothetical protein
MLGRASAYACDFVPQARPHLAFRVLLWSARPEENAVEQKTAHTGSVIAAPSSDALFRASASEE